MAIYTIIGVEPKVFKPSDKNPNGSRAMELHLVGKSANVFGKKASNVTIYDNVACFEQISAFFIAPKELIGFNVTVDYNNKGWLEDFELLDKPVKKSESEAAAEPSKK